MQRNEREGRASAHFIRYIAQHVTFMMRHQPSNHIASEMMGSARQMLLLPLLQTLHSSTEQSREGAVQYTICMNDLHRNWRIFHFKRETYIHRRGYRKPANEPPALNIHNITTLYYYDDDYYYTSCIMYNCQNVPFHFFRKNFNDKEKIRETSTQNAI